MHVLMLVSNPFTHDPRVQSEAHSLTRGGHRVTVVAWDRAGEGPARDVLAGAHVVRVPHTGPMRALPLDILRLPLWWRQAARTARGLHNDHAFDSIHCHDLDTLPTGVALKRRWRIPLVFDAHEIWPRMVARDVPMIVSSYFARKERRLLRHVDHIIVENEPMKAFYEKSTAGRIPVTIIMNAKQVQQAEYDPPGNERLVVLYIGTLGASRFLLETVDALADVPGVDLVVGGIGKPTYAERLRRACQASPNATFLGRVPATEVLPRTRDADVVLCMTDPSDENNRIASANKQFEAMASGRPIVVSAGTYPGDFTIEHDVGLAVPHSRPGVRRGVERLRDDPHLRERLGRNALQAARSGFNWSVQEERLLALYRTLGSGST